MLLFVSTVLGLVHLGTFPPLATVMSSSMSPAVDTGDIVALRSLRGRPPQVGDIVRINVPADVRSKLSYPATIVHRVVAIDLADRTATTKGDNMPDADPFATPFDAIDAEVVLTVPQVGRLIGFLVSPFGLLWIALAAALFIAVPFYDVHRVRNELEVMEVVALNEIEGKIDHLEQTAAAVERATVGAPMLALPPGPTRQDRTLEAILGSQREYGEHLRTHTAILRSMSAASTDLADVAADLRAERPVSPTNAASLPPWSGALLGWLRAHRRSDGTLFSAGDAALALDVSEREVRALLDLLADGGVISLERVAPELLRYRLED